MTDIVILGGGIGGLNAAYDMKEHVGPQDKVTLISDNSYFQFTPSNPWIAVKWREREDICFELEEPLRKKASSSLPRPPSVSILRTTVLSLATAARFVTII